MISEQGVLLDLPPGWECIDSGDKTFTVANRATGIGAMQLSVAIFKEPTDPKPDHTLLGAIVTDLARQNSLGDALDPTAFDDRVLKGAAASFRNGGDFIRVWSVSDGQSFALATYVCREGHEHEEVAVCEAALRSLRFTPSAPGVA